MKSTNDLAERGLRPFFATTAKGTEDLLAEELRELRAGRVRQDRGGVRFFGNLETALRVCLHSRIAMRVLMPIGEGEARGAEGLYDAAAAIAWEEHLDADSTFAVEAVLKESEHSHSGYVALKVKDAIADRLRERFGRRPDIDTRNPAVRIVVRLAGQTASFSLDVTGEPLFQRGYRTTGGMAPLKPTLAAAMLRMAGYNGDAPLLDPLCGSGTILIEGALLASGRAPGIKRRFGIEQWPHVREEATALLADLRADAQRSERKCPAPIYGIDKNPGAISASRANLASARLGDCVTLRVGDATEPFGIDVRPAGYIVTNPPYGERSGGGGIANLKSFYARFGKQLDSMRGWRAVAIAGNPQFEAAFRHAPLWERDAWNGPIECRIYGFEF